ncbi:interleukin-4 [Rhinolophus sinicus]|uniref:interleukin-4 n=1 Tax=Rhinolophus sinicus TaxID=89399 RepID=UPI003D79C465
MHLASPLVPALLCLLACTGNCIQGRERILLREIIETLNRLTEAKTKDGCMELTVAEVLPAPKNTTEKGAFCRAAIELRQMYHTHQCKTTKHLSRLHRNLSSMANMNSCPVNEDKKITLKELLERLKQTMKKKYAKG